MRGGLFVGFSARLVLVAEIVILHVFAEARGISVALGASGHLAGVGFLVVGIQELAIIKVLVIQLHYVV